MDNNSSSFDDDDTKEKTKKDEPSNNNNTTSIKKSAADDAPPSVKAAAAATKTRTSKKAVIDPKDTVLLGAPPIDDDDDDDFDVNNGTEQLVSPGAFHVRRGGGVNNTAAHHHHRHAESLAVSHPGDVVSGLAQLQPPPQQQQPHHPQPQQEEEPFVMVDVVSEEEIRRQYLPETPDEFLVEPVKAEPLKDRKRHHLWIALATIAVVTIVLAAILVPVLVVFLPRKNHPSGSNSRIATPPSSQTTCSITTDVLNSNYTNLTALLLNQSAAVSPPITLETFDDGQTYGTYDAGSDAITLAKTLCLQLGGKFFEEDFTIQCNSSSAAVPTGGNNGTLLAQFKHNFVCVGATCNTSEVESYLQAHIVSQTQVLETQGNKSCGALYGTYTYQNSSSTSPKQQQQGQVTYYLPSLWGEQCALEYDAITASIMKNSTTSSLILPSCQRNGTTNDAVCTVDFTYDATQIVEPFCTHIGGRSLQQNITFQCTSSPISGETYVVNYLNQPVCTGVSCDPSRVNLYTTDLLRSSLVDQGYHNCQLVSSKWYNASNNDINKQQLNETSVLAGECSLATAYLSSNSNVAALYANITSLTAFAPINDFSSLTTDAQTYCFQQTSSQYIIEGFTIVCDDDSLMVQNGTSSAAFNFLNVFFCLGSTCNSTEVESYLDWPLVLLTRALEYNNGGRARNCQVRYGTYTNYSGTGQAEYLPSVWGEQCAVENNVVSSNSVLASLASTTYILPTCELYDGNQTIKCTSDYVDYNAQIESLCVTTVGGLYYEVDFALACASHIGYNITLEYLGFPQCTGMSCNLNQSADESVQTITLLLTNNYALQDCQLLLQDNHPHQNASIIQQQQQQQQNISSSGDGGNCSLGTNILSTNTNWSAFNSRNFGPRSCHPNGKKYNCTTDYSSFVTSANSVCQKAGGHLVSFNFTLGNCIPGDGYEYTLNYVQDFFCFGLSCNASEIDAYRNGVIFIEAVNYFCSQGL